MTLHYALWNLVHLVEAIVLTVVRSVCKCSKLFNAKTNHDHCLLKMLVVWILYTNLEKEKPITGESYAAFIIWSTFGPENSYFSTTIHDAPAVFFFLAIGYTTAVVTAYSTRYASNYIYGHHILQISIQVTIPVL